MYRQLGGPQGYLRKEASFPPLGALLLDFLLSLIRSSRVFVRAVSAIAEVLVCGVLLQQSVTRTPAEANASVAAQIRKSPDSSAAIKLPPLTPGGQ